MNMSNTVRQGLMVANKVGTAIVAHTASQDSLLQAIAGFSQILTSAECANLLSTTAPDALSILNLTSEIDKKRSRRTFQKLSSRFQPFLESIQQFTTVVDTLVSSNPQVAALIWGSVKFVIIIALNFSEYFEKLSKMFEKLGDLCPCYDRFQGLFPESTALRESLTTFYALVIIFCTEALQFLKDSTLTQFGKSLWKPFSARFQDFETKLQNQREKVDREIHLASELAEHRERQRACLYRSEGRQHRLEISLYQDEHRQHHSAEVIERKNNQDWRLKQSVKDKEHRRITLLEKISDYDYRTTFSRVRSQQHKNTGLWFFDCQEFQNWNQAVKSCALWSHGIPGAGKTILAAGTIDYLSLHQQGVQTSISYFFCEFTTRQSRQIRTILGSLIKQILSIFPKISPKMENDLETLFYNPSREPDTKELYQTLLSVVQLSATAYIVIDGIDECERGERRQLLSCLNDLVRNSKSRVRVFISSREEIDISQSLGRFSDFYEIALNPSRTRPDIEVFISDTIDQMLENGDLIIGQPSMANEIKKALIQGSDGMFLWVTFQIDEICRENNDNAIRQVLKFLPRGLNETYTRILQRIVTERKPDVAKKIFQWLASARRPLSLEELKEAIAFEPGCLRWDQGSFPTCGLKMLQNCGNLVNRNKDNDLVQFIHSTVLEFLLSPQLEGLVPSFLILKPKANLYIGSICLTYLSFPDFETQISRIRKETLIPPTTEWINSIGQHTPLAERLWKLNPKRPTMTQAASAINVERFRVAGGQSHQPFERLAQKFCLIEYVSKNWIFHCSEIPQDERNDWELFKRLVFYRALPFPHLPWKRPEEISEDFLLEVLQWAVENDHKALFQLVISELEAGSRPIWACIEQRTGRGQTLLQVASMRGNELLLKALLDLGADINAAPANGSNGQTALQTAAEGGHLGVVDRLLQSGAEVNVASANHDGRTALVAAAEGGHLGVVDRLLQSGAEVNVASAWSGRTALQAAAQSGHLDVVDRLLQSGADVNAASANHNGRTALQAAAEGGHLGVVDRLLQSGAEVNVASAWSGRTALQAAAEGGHLGVVDRLLQSEADVNAALANHYGRTALVAAAEGGHLGVVDRLLQSGAEVNAAPAEYSGRTALQAAAQSGHLDVVDRLLQSGAEVNAASANHNGRTALVAAAEGGHLGVVDRLLQSGAEVNAAPANHNGRTALQAAAEGGHLDVVNRLREAGGETF